MVFNAGKPISSDLVQAIMAVGSKRRYAWDEKLGVVRPAESSDTDVLPTFTQQEMVQLRHAFAEQHSRSEGERKFLRYWETGEVPKRKLRKDFKAAWKEHLFSKVRERLDKYFAEREQRRNDTTDAINSDVKSTSISELPSTSTGEEAVDDQIIASCRDAGDSLGLGEALARKLTYVEEGRLDSVLANVVATWATPLRLASEFESSRQLAARSHEFLPEHLALAFIHGYARLRVASRSLPASANDLAFRLVDAIGSTLNIDQRLAPVPLATLAAVRLESALAALRNAVTAFQTTSVVTSKSASIEVVRATRNLAKLALPNEQPILANLDRLLGSVFRKFCESCERHDDADVVRRVPEIRDQLARSLPLRDDPRMHSRLWQDIVLPVFRHIEALLDEGLRRSEIVATPSLCFANTVVKLDLTGKTRQTFSCRLLNRGDGHGLEVMGTASVPDSSVDLRILEPAQTFEIGGRSEQLVTFGIVLEESRDRLEIPFTWRCQTAIGAKREFQDRLVIEQQNREPDWEKLREAPPYTLKPIQRRDQLFGREHILEDLLLHVAAGTSTFLWGQKRVGKTSVLQVLASELNGRSGNVCLILRMGELVGMHEGQIAHTIARRLNELAKSSLNVPPEAEFGAAIGQAVPFIEKLVRTNRGNYVVIIDEFDDLDPAFYMGERGRQFIKGLRSLSEIGLTFFFVGSERMDSIYQRHQEDLNRWLNLSLSRIESVEDCKALVTRPVAGAIEYNPEAFRRILDYCAGNPFYMQIFCFEVFKRCLQGRRTFVGETDVIAVGDALIHSLGPTNFAHLWLDNPELDQQKRSKQAAENCLVLVCLARLNGVCESIEEVCEVQDKINLAASQQLSLVGIREVIARLRRRGVLVGSGDSGVKVELPIFRDWLNEHGELLLLRYWQEFCSRPASEKETGRRIQVEESPFPVSEDELLAVSQRLVYCGKQKDVAEVRTWLRQFDDDSRIELAFLLLKRMAEKGHVNEGERVFAMHRLQEAVQVLGDDKKRIVWRIVRGRIENLCVSFVDSETKSGASTAREVAKLLRPSKCAAMSEVGSWLRDHVGNDAVLLIVDDFAGTGDTLVRGLERFSQRRTDEVLFRKCCEKGAVHVFLLFAFLDAVRAIQKSFPKIRMTAIRTFGEEVLALDSEAGIFSDEGERKYAQNMLVQIGRQLTSQEPLGHGDMAALIGFHNTIPNNTLPIFWSGGTVNERSWNPLFPRASWR